MTINATHFAPNGKKIWGQWTTRSVPLVSVTAMKGAPELIRAAYGDKVLAKANREIMLDTETIADTDCFIPHTIMAGFADSVAKHAGESDLGLMLAPHLSITNYGCWGDYMLGAPTLGTAIDRLISAIGLHSRGDQALILKGPGVARLCYSSAARPFAGYRHLAPGVAAVLMSICRAYLGTIWRPLRIELDIPEPRRVGRFEDVFGCSIIFDAPTVAICIRPDEIEVRRSPTSTAPLILLEDVARARFGRAGDDQRLCGVTEHVWTQVLSGAVSIESTARALDTSVRTLQRNLSREGVDFRTLVSAARSRRGMELLRGSKMSITDIAMHLGYSSPAHFTRAFRGTTGWCPTEYRRGALLHG